MQWNLIFQMCILLMINEGFSDGSGGKESICNAGDPGPIPGSGISLGEGNGNALQYSCLKSPMDRGAWRAKTYGGHKESGTRWLRDKVHTHTHTHIHEWFCASFHIHFICVSLLRQPLRSFTQFVSVLINFLAFTCKRFFEYNTCKSSLSTNPLEYMWF